MSITLFVCHYVSGRKAFLEVLLAVLEWVLGKKSKSLGIVVPPRDAPADVLEKGIEFFEKQREADAEVG